MLIHIHTHAHAIMTNEPMMKLDLGEGYGTGVSLRRPPFPRESWLVRVCTHPAAGKLPVGRRRGDQAFTPVCGPSWPKPTLFPTMCRSEAC